MSDASNADQKLLKEVSKTIDRLMKGTVHSVEGTPRAPVLMPDGGYKNKPLFAGQELEYTDTYIGKSGKLLFCFSPVDAQEWTRCEFDPKNLDSALPLFGAELASCLSIEEEHVPLIVEFLKTKTLAEIEERKEEERKRSEAALVDNPLFGRF